MRFSPTKILQGLLCTTPVLVLTLAACGGGGGSSDGGFGSAYSLGGTTTGLTSNGLVLRNNGGDDLPVNGAASGVTGFTFVTPVLSTTNYNVTVLTHPSSPPQRCTVDPATASGVMPASAVANVVVNCATAYTIGGTSITGLTGTGLVLQNNGGDNLLIAAGATGPFTFSTPLLNNDTYSVTVLTQPHTPAQTCTLGGSPSGMVGTSNVTSVTINCVANLVTPPSDRFVYAVNYGSNDLWAYSSASGALSPMIASPYILETNPSAIAVDPAGTHVYETNQGGNDIRVYNINSSTGALTSADANGSNAIFDSSIATGPGPIKIRIHPSGRLAYVLNQTNNTVSGYSIDPTTGALSAIDLNGTAIGNTIPARSIPTSIAIHPSGKYAYVTNAGVPGILIYSIDDVTGLLTALLDADNVTTGSQDTMLTGTTPYSIAIDPAGQYAYVANGAGGAGGNGDVWVYPIASDGTLSPHTSTVTAGIGPRAVAIDPSGKFAYVVNGGSGDVSAYTISGGALTQIPCASGCNGVTGNYLAGSSPISLSIDRSGQYVYVANSGSFNVSTYSINTSTGELTEVTGPPPSPYSAGTTPQAITTAP